VTNTDKRLEEKDNGCTWLWRKCCLDKVKEAFEKCGEKNSGMEASQYIWCFTKDVGDMTLERRSRNSLQMGGLLYSQFYGMIKQQFDAAKHYPWAEDDDTMAMMALDDDYMEAYRSVIGVRHIDRNVCRESFNHCGRRVMLSLRLNHGKSWGGREGGTPDEPELVDDSQLRVETSRQSNSKK
jgi:hypothetical protein